MTLSELKDTELAFAFNEAEAKGDDKGLALIKAEMIDRSRRGDVEREELLQAEIAAAEAARLASLNTGD